MAREGLLIEKAANKHVTLFAVPNNNHLFFNGLLLFGNFSMHNPDNICIKSK
jgi:hypothetical protein